MYSSIRLLRKYIHYYIHASNADGHGMHSPFVFDFICNVLNNHLGYKAPGQVEELRKQLLSDKRPITGNDPGAGSRKGKREKKVSDVARAALKPRKYAQMFYRLVKHYQPQRILELGTSLGLTTAYLYQGNPSARVITIEGNTAVAEKAKENFEKLDLPGIELITGNFNDVLDHVLMNTGMIDLAFIDGNHRLQPTMEYFQKILKHVHAGSILVFDDIHWSLEMEEAWKQICEHHQVGYTIDIFFLGFVFFRREFRVKQNFSIRF